MKSAQGPTSERLLLRGGVAGYQLPMLKAATLPVSAGDLLILETDGIHHDFTTDLKMHLPVQSIADHILAKYIRQTDEAPVAVVRYLGTAG